MPHRVPAVLIGGLLLAFAPPAVAAAAPVTVKLRIEGPTRTLFEGPVTTDVGPVDVGDGTGPHPCDGTDNPDVAAPTPTRGNAFFSAATGPGGFSFKGTYTFDLSFSEIAGESVAFDAGSGAFLGEFKNGVSELVGSCQAPIAGGDDVLYAYGPFGTPLLTLSGPSSVAPGATATFKVTDTNSGAPVAGADVGGVLTGADGTLQYTIGDRGPHAFKATKAGAIRSNRVDVCVTDGADGACGTTAPILCATSGGDGGLCGAPDRIAPDRIAPGATLTGITDGARFTRASAPRRLRAAIDADPSGILAVKLRLTRNDRGRCTYFSGTSERFRTNRRARCGAQNGFWFAIPVSGSDVDYLLPGALPRGHYVLDVNVIDRAFNRDDARRRGANRITFDVA